MSKLIIAEKPSVAKSIASALGASSRADGFYEGSGLIVSWCVGHLVSPLDAGGYDERFKKWRYEDLPILLIRRLTPLECERLQGFPDGWTDIPGASDSARYKALGNSVAIPCVDFVMKCMVDAIQESERYG